MCVTGELSGQGAELLLRFHTSDKERPRYTIQTHGDVDTVIALLGPDDYTKQIRCVNVPTEKYNLLVEGVIIDIITSRLGLEIF